MFFEILVVISAALGGSGAVLGVCKLMGVKPPKWVAPMSAAVAMIAFVVWSRETWYDRTAGRLPEGVTVLATFPYDGVLEPWGLANPRISRFIALDANATMRNPAHPKIVMATTMLREQYGETITLRQIIDCENGRRALVPPNAQFDEAGLPVGVDWISGGEPGYLFGAVCGG